VLAPRTLTYLSPAAALAAAMPVSKSPTKVTPGTGVFGGLVLHRPDVDLCLADPGFDTDLCVTTDVRTFTRVYLGHVSIAHALGEGSVTVAGRSDLRRAFGGWLGLSPFASPRA
jgi:hypothetical protein